MASSAGFVDFYELLGLDGGDDPSAVDAAAIKKAYRRQALLHHPDKAKGGEAAREAAAEMFDKIQKAYDALCDATARAAFDAVYVIRREREAARMQQSAKRRRMMEELEARERNAAVEKDREAEAAARLAAELARLRAKRERDAAGDGAAARGGGPTAATVAEDDDPQIARTLKVTWLLALGEYGADALRVALSAYGGVDDVILLGARRKKGVAWVVMADDLAAARAAAGTCGRREAPLTVSRHPSYQVGQSAQPKVAAAAAELKPQPQQKQQQGQHGAAKPAAAAKPATATALGHRGFEDMVLQRMRQAAERKRLAKELEEQDAAEEAAAAAASGGTR